MDNIFTTAKTQNSKQRTNEYYVYVGNEDFIDDNNNLRSEVDDDRVLAKKIYIMYTVLYNIYKEFALYYR